MLHLFPYLPARRGTAPEADVCLIAEGCYPYVSGGVSSWIDWLMRSQPELSFSVLAILPTRPDGSPRYPRPDNLRAIHHMRLDDLEIGFGRNWPEMSPKWLAQRLVRLLQNGEFDDLGALLERLGAPRNRPQIDVLLNSRQAWETLCKCYAAMPQSSFLAYFWAWRTLAGGLFRALTFPLPSARVYHAVSTGYAGLVGARAALETGRPSLITEHGIYSNERRIEILMAEWITNSIDTGFDFSDDREDVRDFWAAAFESFARIGYEAASEVVALYADNNAFQQALGAEPTKLRVIPNGVDIARFQTLPERRSGAPTIAFIGRVTPIKDVQTFIDVAEQVAHAVPGLRALVIGPMDEDPEYARSCMDEVRNRGLSDMVSFTGPVDVRDYFGEIDVMVLTSISEAQPLVILEAGASGVPCVATDVGACREILEGAADGRRKPEAPGGIVVPVGAPGETAQAVIKLLTDPELRHTYGETLRARVHDRYRSETIARTYADFYGRYLATPSTLEA
ncbi:GT4 family glycosyltransferase PelF [Pelagibacterium sediminicola]|uniref:GT4 family glycosyltransferase PelF n=1 Tax=Pelagibacterium sediminicola TaxID=2248761 RepID=UPI000E317CBA|nr:GT4 family glycosyltransferase PelF [Pelagibacterium sediminicola]